MSFREVGRAMPAPDPIVDSVATNAAVDANDGAAVLKHLEIEQRLANAAAAAIEQVSAASPKKRVMKVIEWAAGYLGADANAEQLAFIESRIKYLAFNAIQFIERCDVHGLDRLIGSFESDMRGVEQLATPPPPKPRRVPTPPAGGRMIGIGLPAFVRALRGEPKGI